MRAHPAPVRIALLAALIVLPLLPAVAAHAAQPRVGVRVQVLSASPSEVLDRGAVRVRVRASRTSVVRLTAKGRDTTGARRRFRLAGRSFVRFRRAGARTVSLRFSRAGRSALARRVAGCRRTRVTVFGRGRAYGLSAPEATFSRGNRSRRTQARQATRSFPADGRGCPDATLAPGRSAAVYRVGIAQRDINPGADGRFEGKPVYLGGYGLASPPVTGGRAATGILGPGLQVRAISVSDGKNATAIADMEVQGWFTANKDGPLGIVDMRKAVEQRTGGGLKASQVIIQSDHTHGGPDPIGVWGGVPIGYRRMIFERTVEAIVEAFSTAARGTLHYGTADGRDLLSNQFDYDAANKVVDSDVRVLQARGEDGTAFATLLNFSAHTTVLGSGNTKVTGDWLSFANPLLEQRFGGRAMTMVGTLGRTQPADRGCPDKEIPKGEAQDLCTAQTYATRVVDRAEQAVKVAEPIPGNPVVAATSFLIQDPADNAVILGLNYGGDPAGAPVNRALTPPWLVGNVVGTVTATARIGDVLLSTFPGEAYPQIPLKVRELVPLRGYMTAGLAQDQLGYLIAPYESYPEPVRRNFFNQRGDEVSPISNDNYAFNVSKTMGERIICSSLRGAGEVLGRGLDFRSRAGERCAPFANDLQQGPGADVR